MDFNILIERNSIFWNLKFFLKIIVYRSEPMNFLGIAVGLLDNLSRHRNDSCHFRVNRSSRANEFFQVWRYNTAPILGEKNGFEHIFEIGIYKGINFGLRGKIFKSFSNKYIFV